MTYSLKMTYILKTAFGFVGFFVLGIYSKIGIFYCLFVIISMRRKGVVR